MVLVHWCVSIYGSVYSCFLFDFSGFTVGYIHVLLHKFFELVTNNNDTYLNRICFANLELVWWKIGTRCVKWNESLVKYEILISCINRQFDLSDFDEICSQFRANFSSRYFSLHRKSKFLTEWNEIYRLLSLDLSFQPPMIDNNNDHTEISISE